MRNEGYCVKPDRDSYDWELDVRLYKNQLAAEVRGFRTQVDAGRGAGRSYWEPEDEPWLPCPG